MSCTPAFHIPPGAIANVSIIDTTFRVADIPTIALMKPDLPGFETLPAVPTWSWLIESNDGRKALFDLGVPKDREKSYSPALNARIPDVANITVEREVADTLREAGFELEEIDSIIWSHWHWDHIGDPTTFPKSTDLVVGPGFKDNFLPGYPIDPKSYMMDSHFRGRNLVEIDFKQDPSLKAGRLPAHDFFGDGSFYLLDIPGHAIGQLGGLARTSSNPDTFILMGADVCHHGSAVRPSHWLHYPEDEPPLPLSDLEKIKAQHHGSCPGGEEFEKLNAEVNKTGEEPIFGPNVYVKEQDAIDSLTKVQYADMQENIFFTFAHDATMEGVVDLFPQHANNWKEKGWKKTIMWRFLKDLMPALDLVESN